MKASNHPFTVWSACFLWFTSIFSITWALLIFYCIGDILVSTGMDIINAFMMLSGIIMVPMNVHILYSIANGKRISRDSKVICCPLWLCILWVIAIDIAGVVLCAKRISCCYSNTISALEDAMNNYRISQKYKRFMDNIQWSLKCCGIESFKDWFSRDWYDKIRDYEWDPSSSKHNGRHTKDTLSATTDSVPLSCCKSGSCISNYLMELGTRSINTRGCSNNLHKTIMITMIAYLILFLLVILDEMLLLKYIMAQDKTCMEPNARSMDIMHILSAKDNFRASSGSRQLNPNDNDSEEDSFVEDRKHDTD